MSPRTACKAPVSSARQTSRRARPPTRPGVRLGIGGGTFDARSFASSLAVTTSFASPFVANENAQVRGLQFAYDLPLGTDDLAFGFDRRGGTHDARHGAHVRPDLHDVRRSRRIRGRARGAVGAFRCLQRWARCFMRATIRQRWFRFARAGRSRCASPRVAPTRRRRTPCWRAETPPRSRSRPNPRSGIACAAT